ncbi:MAG TPA: hypothetical protein VN920_03720 [Pyrinomonadaceae bacterium]|nr:hypothetical protein [Pyrinomonadaceae bacterium]
MKTFRLSLILAVTACLILIGSKPRIARSASPAAIGNAEATLPAANLHAAGLPAATWRELGRALIATAKYNDVRRAVADGYVLDGAYEPGEGLHYVNFSLLDATFDIEHPEVLLYVPVPGSNHLRLVALEYVVPIDTPGTPPPAGFTGNADVWRMMSEGFPDWSLNVWIWSYNPDGIFAFKNPRVP